MSDHKPNSVPRKWVRRILGGFFILCGVLLGLDFVRERVVHHPIEDVKLIYPFFGFFGISLLILISKLLRRLVGRSEDYYDAE